MTFTPSDPQPMVIYRISRGWLFIRIDRYFLPDGQNETVQWIPKWLADAEWIATQSWTALQTAEEFKVKSTRP